MQPQPTQPQTNQPQWGEGLQVGGNLLSTKAINLLSIKATSYPKIDSGTRKDRPIEVRIFETLLEKDLVVEGFRAWWCYCLLRVGGRLTLKLAERSLNKDNPQRYFAKCMKRELERRQKDE